VRLVQMLKLQSDNSVIINMSLHEQIVESIKQRDSGKAVRLVREHLIPYYKLNKCVVVCNRNDVFS
jgi:DNA-binding FadR family transcriptional regulator